MKAKPNYNSRIFSAADPRKSLDAVQLNRLEQSFRQWVEASERSGVRASRLRILLIFLIIRYAGAKLSEALNLDPRRDIDFDQGSVLLGRRKSRSGRTPRSVQLPENVCGEIRAMIPATLSGKDARDLFHVDPGFVRRKFYERAEACGLPRQLGAPEMLRKSRAVELMQNNLPLPAVQQLLGHSTPNLASSLVSFSEEEIRQVTRLIVEKEAARKTSARNSFYGKVATIRKGDIQARVEIVTPGGDTITTMITRDSLRRLGLRPGKLITAEVKAPWVLLHKGDQAQASSADNRLKGVVETIARGAINTEYLVRMADGTGVCSIVTSESSRRLDLSEGEAAWVLFNSYSVVLLSE